MPAREPALPAIPRLFGGLSARRIDDSIAILRRADGTAIPRVAQEGVIIPPLPVGDQVLLQDDGSILHEDGSFLLTEV
jgi:hypothetical protein